VGVIVVVEEEAEGFFALDNDLALQEDAIDDCEERDDPDFRDRLENTDAREEGREESESDTGLDDNSDSQEGKISTAGRGVVGTELKS